MNKVFILLLFGAFILNAAEKSAISSNLKKLAVMPSVHKGIIDLYCLDCHNSEKSKGDINLEGLSFDLSSSVHDTEIWQYVLDEVNAGNMPPKKKKQLTKKEKTIFLDDLSNVMVAARKIHSDNGGIVTLRRLNRREYANTLEVLLGVKPDVDDLPDDIAGEDFDTEGASLYFSSDQFEQYLKIAHLTLEKAFFNKAVRKGLDRMEVERRYGKEYYEKKYKPIRTLGEKADQYLVAKKGTNKKDLGFKSKSHAQLAKRKHNLYKSLMDDLLNRPAMEHGTILTRMRKFKETTLRLKPITAQLGETVKVRVRAAAYPGIKERFYYIELRAHFHGERKTQIIGWRKVTAPIDKPQILEFTVPAFYGEKVQYVIGQRSHLPGSKNDLKIATKVKKLSHTPLAVWVDWVEVERSGRDSGYSPQASEIFFEKADSWSEAHYAREILKRFASRAFRTTKPTDRYIDKLVNIYKENRARGNDFRQALILPLSIILSDPKFLYMIESEESKFLSDIELAVRLSYFLWSMPPDNELLSLAKQGKLSNQDVLKKQTSRLLADERSNNFIEAFTYQWLEMKRLGMFVFDTFIHQDYDQAVYRGSKDEIYKTVRHLINNKLPLNKLLKSDFVVINKVMADYYKLEVNIGYNFQPVKLPSDSVRGGLLSSAAVLAMGSDGKRSSPVERGAWVLRHLLNNPPPPAPANVPQLDRFEDPFQPARKLGIAHQEEPQCVQCHQKIDPIGYGMENFDAAGLWREKETVYHEKQSKSFDIDPSGELPGGIAFKNFLEFRDSIAGKQDDFARGFTEALIAYGLGRPYSYSDYNFAESLMAAAKPKDYSIPEFIHTLVQSKKFRSK